jgi:hypothetical protein
MDITMVSAPEMVGAAFSMDKVSKYTFMVLTIKSLLTNTAAIRQDLSQDTTFCQIV